MKKIITYIAAFFLIAQYLFATPITEETHSLPKNYIVQQGPAVQASKVTVAKQPNLSEQQEKDLNDAAHVVGQVLASSLFRYSLINGNFPNISTKKPEELSQFLDMDIVLPNSCTFSYTPEAFYIRYYLTKSKTVTLTTKKVDDKFQETTCGFMGDDPLKKEACTEVCTNRHSSSPRQPQSIVFTTVPMKNGNFYYCHYK